jgi:hypothetical protein
MLMLDGHANAATHAVADTAVPLLTAATAATPAHLNTFLSLLDRRGRSCCCIKLSGKPSSAAPGLQQSLHEENQSHLLHLAWSTAIPTRAKAEINQRLNRQRRSSYTCMVADKTIHDQHLAMRRTGRPAGLSTPTASSNSPQLQHARRPEDPSPIPSSDTGKMHLLEAGTPAIAQSPQQSTKMSLQMRACSVLVVHRLLTNQSRVKLQLNLVVVERRAQTLVDQTITHEICFLPSRGRALVAVAGLQRVHLMFH